MPSQTSRSTVWEVLLSFYKRITLYILKHVGQAVALLLNTTLTYTEAFRLVTVGGRTYYSDER